MVMDLELQKLTCGYGREAVISEVSLMTRTGEVLCLLGPNGVGKTTLFKTILGFLKMLGGRISLDGEDIAAWSRKRLAKAVGYVPQAHIPPFPFKVADVVVMGRTAHLGPFATPSPHDQAIADAALERLHIDYLRDRIYTEISGGERQMVLIARALTQQPKLLILDEPTSNLDFGNQIRVLQQINELARQGLGVIMTSHFPDHAFLCASKVVIMQKGGLLTIGNPDEIVTEDYLRATYGVTVKIITDKLADGQDVRACVPLIA
jgi:iron complex transport system ATP-binding protein